MTDLDVLRIREAAELLKVHPNTVYSLVRAGEIPSVRVGAQIRIPSSGLRRLLDGPDGREGSAGLTVPESLPHSAVGSRSVRLGRR